RDGELRVARLSRGGDGDGDDDAEEGHTRSGLEVEHVDVLQANAEVWRVRWNVTGTVLASSGDDGQVKLWRTDYQASWQCISSITGDLSAVDLLSSTGPGKGFGYNEVTLNQGHLDATQEKRGAVPPGGFLGPENNSSTSPAFFLPHRH
ncbi:unnamed protein product, partial [Heterosigma akashiwo]